MPKKKTASAAGSSTKKAFKLGRDSVYVADPIKDLRICGAKGVVPPDEAGDLDTYPGPNVPVSDLRRLQRALSVEFLENIYLHGVRTPIIIAKIDDVATVIAGKSRVRAARKANRKREKLGRTALIKPRCVMQRVTDKRSIYETMISENNARSDDDLADQIDKLKAYLETGASMEDASVEFNKKVATLQGWLDFDDQASDETKAAVRDGLAASTAIEIAKFGEPEKQNFALAKILAAPGVKQRSARAARAMRRGASENPIPDRASQRLLLGHVTRVVVEDSSGEDGFWAGVREALRLVTGHEGKVDKRLAAALESAREVGDKK